MSAPMLPPHAAPAGGLSIVVPTYHSSKYLARLLESIERADQRCGPLEILVVDDSRPDEAERTRALCAAHGATFLNYQGNVARKRNYGGERSAYATLLFVDSDCEVTPSLLAEHARLAGLDERVGAMLGVVEFVGADSFMWRVVERTQFLGPYSFARRMEYAPWGGAGNLSVRKQVFQEIGGFDPTFLRAPGGEDVDLGLRLNKAGYRIKCNPHAMMFHTRETWQGYRRMLRRVYGYGRAHYHILTKHADMTGYEFPRLAGVFAMALVALLIGAVRERSAAPLALALLYWAVVPLLQAGMVLAHDRRPLRSIHQEVVAHSLDLTFEWGILVESLKHGDLRGFYRKIIYAPQQLISERDRKIVQMWSLILGFVLIALFAA